MYIYLKFPHKSLYYYSIYFDKIRVFIITVSFQLHAKVGNGGIYFLHIETCRNILSVWREKKHLRGSDPRRCFESFIEINKVTLVNF
ncbi:hypothetical protein AB685_07875 [Bacillus sp. LL01]|nr:hypothetical protein AB685_07875 [Bacillus sp. LL01]